MADVGIFVTGFPGFIAGRLIERLIENRDDNTHFYFLVQPQFSLQARMRCQELERLYSSFQKHWHLIEGDLRQADLGIDANEMKNLVKTVREVWHLAAIYNLSIDQATAYSVNVDGTIHVLDFCEKLKTLDALHYISTCYVAGDRSGTVRESELDAGQGFKNHYESTKCWAEKHVQHRAAKIPTVIYRPAIVVGDSKTGETAKGDGPYYVMNLLLWLPRKVPMVHLGPSLAKVNLVPVDYLIDAMVMISKDKKAVGKVFQIADPNPKTAKIQMK